MSHSLDEPAGVNRIQLLFIAVPESFSTANLQRGPLGQRRDLWTIVTPDSQTFYKATYYYGILRKSLKSIVRADSGEMTADITSVGCLMMSVNVASG